MNRGSFAVNQPSTSTVGESENVPKETLGGFSRKEQIAYLLLIRPFWTIKLFMTRRQIRLLNSKTTDLDWYHSRYYEKLK